MKKLIQIISLRNYKTEVIKKFLEENPNHDNFYILYTDGTYEEVYFKGDLISVLEKDHIKPIRYIFDANDRIIIDRKIHIGGITK